MHLKATLVLFLVCISTIHTLDWNSAMQTTISTAAGTIPFVGTFLSAIVSIFWPPSSADIWDSIKERVAELVDSKILEAELSTRKNEIGGIKLLIDQYLRYSPKYELEFPFRSQKGAFLEATLTQIIMLKNNLQKSSNDVHLVHLTLTVAYLHMSVLKERHVYAKTLWPNDVNQNRSELFNDIKLANEEYKTYFTDVFGRWKQWRVRTIAIKHRLDTKVCSFRTGCGSFHGKEEIEFRKRSSMYYVRKLFVEIRDNVKNPDHVIWSKDDQRKKDNNIWAFSNEAKAFKAQYLVQVYEEFNRIIMERVSALEKLLDENAEAPFALG